MIQMKTFCLIGWAALLVACGGGGGNPGDCRGSEQYCAAAKDRLPSVQPGQPDFVPVSDAQLQSITCPGVLELNGGDKRAARLAANDAYARGAKDLDGPPTNGIACDSLF